MEKGQRVELQQSYFDWQATLPSPYCENAFDLQVGCKGTVKRLLHGGEILSIRFDHLDFNLEIGARFLKPAHMEAANFGTLAFGSRKERG